MRKIIDINGDGKIDTDDQYFAASPLPKASGGIFFELKWKEFDLNLAFDYSIGRHLVSLYQSSSLQASTNGGGPLMVDLRDFDPANYPYLQYYRDNDTQYASGFNTFDSDIEKVHMLRLKQLTLGYNLRPKWAGKVGMSSARLFVTAENLFLLTNYSGLDPEIVDVTDGMDGLGSYPLPRKFTVGLTLNF